MNVSPLVFDNALTAPNSPNALDVHRIIPYINDHFILGRVILKNIVKPLAPIKAAASSSSFPSELSTGIISLDTYGNVTNIVASTTPGIAKAILILLPVNSLNHLITG